MSKVSFNNKQSPFFSCLKDKVNHYFAVNNIDRSGNRKLYTKSLLQILSALTLYITLVFFTPGLLVSIILCILLGVNLAVIGFNIMHEGGHQTFSKHKSINTIGGYFLNLLGGTSFFWKIKHNINHHTYTNIEGMDSDIDLAPFMRVHQNQPKHRIYRVQHLYCLFLYGFSYLAWVFYDDFNKYFTGTIAAGQKKKMNLKEHLIFWCTKVFYITAYLVVPMIMAGALKALIGFLIVCFVTEITIGTVFQLAHVVEGTSFPEPNEKSRKIEQEWALHQISTTANFSTKNKAISWLLGGFNFQVEHHLFPRISHVHYPKINEFVRETCEEFKVNYLEYSSVFKAINSHFAHLKKMGKAA